MNTITKHSRITYNNPNLKLNIMIRLLYIVLFTLAGYSGYAQISSPDGGSYTGADPVLEGSTQTYTFYYQPDYSMPLSGMTISFSAFGGEVISGASQPFTAQVVSFTIKWGCQQTQGAIYVGINGNNPLHIYNSFEHPITILTHSNYTEFCNQIYPEEQYPTSFDPPLILSVTNCANTCESVYEFTYQWEWADISISDPYGVSATWQPIPNEINPTYQPPLPPYLTMKAYRRITRYPTPGNPSGPEIEKFSKPGFVRHIPQLDPGTISTTTPVINVYHIVPTINSLLPATGGFCDPVNYVYSWEATNANGAWIEIGNSENFPPNAEEISYTKKYRRKINCGGEIKYTNEITIYFDYIPGERENRNYTRETDVLVPGVANWNEVDGSLEAAQKLQNTTYLDGFGRPIQKVSRETGTPKPGETQWYDNVQIFQYDLFGRQPKQYLQYSTVSEIGKFKTNALGEQKQYYNDISNDIEGDYALSLSTFDNSPLNRVVNTKTPGKEWHLAQGTFTDFDYPFNKESEKIPIVNIKFDEAEIPYTEGFYDNKLLIRSITRDVNNNRTIAYTNRSGLVVLKKVELKQGASEYVIDDNWLCTYNVYDDFGRLRYTIEPEAVRFFASVEWNFSADNARAVLDGLCFKYYYDERGNVITKKTPGDEELRMVYDKRKRLILWQDGNMRNAQPFPKAKLSLYDDNDKLVISALYNFNQGPTFEDYRDNIVASNPNQVTNIFQADLSNASVTTVQKYLYYNGYTFPLSKPFNTGFNNTLAYSATGDVQPIVFSRRTNGLATGSSTLVLDGTNTTYLNATTYYNENGLVTQTLADNITGQSDIVTNQYHWTGRLLSSETIHSSGGTYTNFSIITKNLYDKTGRIIAIEKKVGSNAFKKISGTEYDDLGRMKVKHLSPDYTGTNGDPDIETLNYRYTLQGKLEGINKDYALKTPGRYSKSGSVYGKFFGLYQGYDIKPYDGNLFTNSLLTGQVAAQVWNTLGDDEQRKYEYTYDATGRFTSAAFWQRHSDPQTWDNTRLDYSVGGLGGGGDTKIEYDFNGNIISMWQKGILTGSNTPLFIDRLYYLYHSLPNSTANITGNRLKGIIDLSNMDPYDNGKLGDFINDENVDFKDYDYDYNGNLIYDANKSLKDLSGGQPCLWGTSGIRYNHLNEPDEVHINGKGTVKTIYDADGNKLCKAFESDATGQTTATTYIGAFVYRSTYANGAVPFEAGSMSTILGNLSCINFEEGRIRVMRNDYSQNPDPSGSPIPLDFRNIQGNAILGGQSPNIDYGSYDYFIKDQLQNVRMVVTEEVHTGKATCTMDRQEEIGIFDYPTGAVIDKHCIPTGDCVSGSPWITGSNANVVKLSKTGYKLGPNTLQKVMAGDKISARCQYFYNETPVNFNEETSLPEQILNSLLNSISIGSVVPGPVKDQLGSGRDLALNIPSAINTVAAPDETDVETTPKAYLTMLFFDERFNFVGEGSGNIRATEAGDGATPLAMPDIPAPKNGYVYIYVSNESDIPVYFDNLEVVVERGELIEENHYYPFGLKIATLSSVKAADPEGAEGHIKNNRQYQGKHSEFDEELGWNDFEARNYDSQTGRWLQVDPLADKSPGISPYAYCLNNPIKLTDPDGKLPIETVWDIGNVLYDLGKIGVGTLTGNPEMAAAGLFDLVPDLISAGTPYVPAGLSKFRYADDVARMGLSAEKYAVDDLVKIAARADKYIVDNTANATSKWGWKMGDPLRFPGSKTSGELFQGIGGSSVGQGFNSFSSFKRTMGPAGPGQAWHHIVEKRPSNITQFGEQAINNTDNLIKLPHGKGTIHAKVSGYYSSIQPFSEPETVRQWLNPQSFQAQYDFGIETLKNLGWKP